MQRHSNYPSSSGMALVIVLGLISLLLISSVTFAIMMRIERASSANARNTIMARQFAKSTLASAIAAINYDIGDSKWPHWDAGDNNHKPDGLPAPDRYNPMWKYTTDPTLPLDSSGAAADKRDVFFWKDTFGSVDHNIIKDEYKKRRAVARILSGQLQYFLPYGIRHRAYAEYYEDADDKTWPPTFPTYDYDAIAPEWVPMTAGTNAVNMNNIVGRYAFLAFNTSGYLDIPALCKEGDALDRGHGASAAEIHPVEGLFKKAYGNGDKFKDKNKGRSFETIAEIIRANEFTTGAQGENLENATPFANGAAYSAFNFSPVGRMPTNDIPADLYDKTYREAKFPFIDRICIAGDGSQNHIDSLRRHKAAIITAFKLAGLNKSSYGFEHEAIKDSACTDKKCTVCGGTAPAYTLAAYKAKTPEDGVTEQALWAYLGLVDYIDDDDYPEPLAPDHSLKGDEEYEAYARPATENTPLFNGFMATLKIYREDVATNATITIDYDHQTGAPITEQRSVFAGDRAIYGVEFNGKVIFANRNAANENSEAYESIMDKNIEAELGFLLQCDNGEVWEALVEAAQGIQFEDDTEIELDPDTGEGGIIFRSKENAWTFGDGPLCFHPKNNMVISNAVFLAKNKIITDPTNEDDKNEKFPFPELIYVGATGLAKDGNTVIHRVPALRETYEEPDVGIWLTSRIESEDEGLDFTQDKCYSEPTGRLAFPTLNMAETSARNDPSYPLQRKVVNLIVWGEMIDPAFSCASAAEELVNDEFTPRSTVTSHNDFGGGGSWATFASAKKVANSPIIGFWDFEPEDSRAASAKDFYSDIIQAQAKTEQGNKKFKDMVEEFRNDSEYFFGYFTFDAQLEGEDGEGERRPGYSLLQRFLLTDEDAVRAFPGIRDGIRRNKQESGYLSIDGFFQQFHSLHVRNNGLDSVGELGFLPIGPYATIRLFGFDYECDDDRNCNLDKVNRTISTFNAIPYRDSAPNSSGKDNLYSKPFHRVLDFFSSSYKPRRGLVNINSSDNLAMASIFNDVTLNDMIFDDIGDASECLSEDNNANNFKETDLFVKSLRAALELQYNDGIAQNLSDIGWLYDTDKDSNPNNEDYYEDISNCFRDHGVYSDSNQGREAVIRNTCGLFTDRGLNISLLIRGEAFTPFFGRSDVRNDLGTTLASRTAFAQIWRDTEPDADGNYPFFIQYFKIFDE